MLSDISPTFTAVAPTLDAVVIIGYLTVKPYTAASCPAPPAADKRLPRLK